MKRIAILGAPLLLFHLLRNISNLYLVVVGCYLLFVALCVIVSDKNNNRNVLLLFSFVYLIYALIASALSGAEESVYVGIFRLFYLLPVIILFFIADFDERVTNYIWVFLLLFIVACSLSIFYQYLVAPIQWFAESSGRANTDRFASLSGSLTSFGAIVGVGVFLAFFIIKNIFIKSFVLIILFLGVILSLQKMAIGFYVFSVLASLFVMKWRLSFKVLSQAFIFIIVLFILYFFLFDYFDANFGNNIKYFKAIFSGDTSSVGDVTVVQSIMDRLVYRPEILIEHWGWLRMIIGVGVYGGAGGLGYRDLPMAHNLIFETLAIFGFIFGGLLLAILIRYFFIAISFLGSSDTNLKIASLIYMTSILTNILSGGLFYHPVLGLIFWFSFSILFKGKSYVRK